MKTIKLLLSASILLMGAMSLQADICDGYDDSYSNNGINYCSQKLDESGITYNFLIHNESNVHELDEYLLIYPVDSETNTVSSSFAGTVSVATVIEDGIATQYRATFLSNELIMHVRNYIDPDDSGLYHIDVTIMTLDSSGNIVGTMDIVDGTAAVTSGGTLVYEIPATLSGATTQSLTTTFEFELTEEDSEDPTFSTSANLYRDGHIYGTVTLNADMSIEIYDNAGTLIASAD